MSATKYVWVGKLAIKHYLLLGAEGASVDPWGFVTPVEGFAHAQGMIRYPDLRIQYDDERNQQEFWYGSGRNCARIYECDRREHRSASRAQNR